MIVLTVGGSRLVDVDEIKVIPWIWDNRQGNMKHIPVESFGWSQLQSETRHRFAVSSANGISRNNTIQLSRMCKTYEEADTLLKAFARSLQPTFFYDENIERKTEKESTSKAKALTKQKAAPIGTAIEDAVVRAEA